MRALLSVSLLLAAAGCSRPPSADTFTAAPLSSSFVALRSPNGQRQVLLVRAGSRWQGHLDDTFAATAHFVAAESIQGEPLALVHTLDPAALAVDVSEWKPVRGLPVVIAGAWVAGDPALRADGPSSLVSLLQVSGDSGGAESVSAALAAELEAAVGLIPPPGDTLDDPGGVASRVAVEAAVRAVAGDDTGAVNPIARMAVFQTAVLLNARFLAVEHQVFEDHGGEDGGSLVSRFTLHDLDSGGALDIEILIDPDLLARLGAISGATETPAGWYPARPGIVLVFRSPVAGGERRVVPWREVLPLLPQDSPLRAVAESVH